MTTEATAATVRPVRYQPWMSSAPMGMRKIICDECPKVKAVAPVDLRTGVCMQGISRTGQPPRMQQMCEHYVHGSIARAGDAYSVECTYAPPRTDGGQA